VAAAKLVLRLDREDGREPDPIAVMIANAKPRSRKKWEAEQAAKKQAEDEAAEKADEPAQADADG